MSDPKKNMITKETLPMMSEGEIVNKLESPFSAESTWRHVMWEAAKHLRNLRARLDAAEKELAKRAIGTYRGEQTKQVDEIIRDQISRVKVLESTFRHVHVSNGVNDLCKQCGLDLRDPIHERFR